MIEHRSTLPRDNPAKGFKVKDVDKTKAQLINELEQARQRIAGLEVHNQQLHSIMDALPVCISYVDATQHCRFANQAYEEWFGITNAELEGRHLKEIMGETAYQAGIEGHVEAVLSGEKVNFKGIVHVEGSSVRYVDVTWIPHFGVRKAVKGFFGFVRDITEYKQSEEQLQMFSHAISQSFDGVNITDMEGNIIFCNEASAKLYGYEIGELIGQHVSILNAQPGLAPGKIIPAIKAFGGWRGELRQKRKDGATFLCSMTTSLIQDESGTSLGMLGIVRDITERVQTEDKMKASLKEKEVLLKEIHHRVNNNLQVIDSLINLQSIHFSDGKTSQMFQEIRTRIRSMASIHRMLYQSKDLFRIAFGEYIQNLARNLFYAYRVHSEEIRLKLDVDNRLFLDIEMATPCGLIINELVSNALKYAFPKGKTGEICIDFHLQGSQFRLTVGDNGVGLPEGLDLQNSETLGLQLVTMLTKQLDGSINLDKTNGTQFEIAFDRHRSEADENLHR